MKNGKINKLYGPVSIAFSNHRGSGRKKKCLSHGHVHAENEVLDNKETIKMDHT